MRKKKILITAALLTLYISAALTNIYAEESPRVYILKGKEYYMKGDYQSAINFFQIALKTDPKNFEALHYIGGAYFHLGNYPESIASYTKALEVDPRSYHTLHYRGLAKYTNKQINESVDDYSKALDIRRDYLNSLFSRGLAYLDLGNNDKAIDDFLLYLIADSNNYQVWYLKGLALYRKGDKESAGRDFERAKSLAGKSLPDYSENINPFSILTPKSKKLDNQGDKQNKDKTRPKDKDT